MVRAGDVVEPTDAGILETLSKKVIRDGEKRLMLAMLENATEDFQKYVFATDKKGKELFDFAEGWILETDNPSFFSFNSICEHLELRPRLHAQRLHALEASQTQSAQRVRKKNRLQGRVTSANLFPPPARWSVNHVCRQWIAGAQRNASMPA